VVVQRTEKEVVKVGESGGPKGESLGMWFRTRIQSTRERAELEFGIVGRKQGFTGGNDKIRKMGIAHIDLDSLVGIWL
jgi:hypothetical protein